MRQAAAFEASSQAPRKEQAGSIFSDFGDGQPTGNNGNKHAAMTPIFLYVNEHQFKIPQTNATRLYSPKTGAHNEQ